MSVLIKGMKMPENCIQCFAQMGGWCFVAPPEIDEKVAPTVEKAAEQGRPEWCPLIELPDHGDLIDKTDLMASLADWQLSEAPEEGINWDSGRNVTSHELQYSIYRLLGDVYEEVRDEPVVIQAERSEE